MTINEVACNSGLPALDRILQGVRLGDNVVVQVDNMDDYVLLVHPFVKAAHDNGKTLIYFRFAEHAPVIPEGFFVHVHELHPEEGYENFISQILDVIEKAGKGAFYVFDCLSDLAVDWYSDRMLGNFFMITCPYLFDLDTVAYFALLRDHHTTLATSAIHGTAQIVLDVYRHKNDLYIHPQKVLNRYSSTMYMLHKWDGGDILPVTKSITTAEILTSVPQPWLDFSVQRRDVWTRNFISAREAVKDGRSGAQREDKDSELFQRLLRMVITRDERFLGLARKYFDLTDLVNIGKRMIGTGLIGGKSVGMLLARAIMRKNEEWDEKLEQHDSFYIGSDVFYTYLIRNKCWWLRRRLNSNQEGDGLAEEVRRLLMAGEFPRDTKAQFVEMLEYFGQSPIIVRSSSLLEDAYGNSFSGKYESIFCTNQGTPEERLGSFIDAVRTVYASTVSKEALAYRSRWGLLEQDEQMALLVQRVSGAVYEDQYFPQIAGVAFSFNPFAWDNTIDPRAGMMRLVFGLGTRAVGRVDNDYTRIVALNAPLRRPETTSGEVRKYAQHQVDVLDMKSNALVTKDLEDVLKNGSGFPIQIFASKDEELERSALEQGREDVFSWVLTFEGLLSQGTFVEDMRKMASVLQKAYSYPVDIEFTVNFLDEKNYRINLLQCRPFQVKGDILSVEAPRSIPSDDVILRTRGPVIGSSRTTTIDRIIYVVPEAYGNLNTSDRYTVARMIGQLTNLEDAGRPLTIMLIGPGRWATKAPELGVPVSFAEISKVSVLCEVAAIREFVIPEISLGTHFFNDLVEMDMLYLAMYPHKPGHLINRQLFADEPNILTRLIPEAQVMESVIRVIDSPGKGEERCICLHADVLKQNAVCYFEERA